MKYIIDLLQISEWYAAGECIDIAKGKHKLELTLKDKVKQEKRRKAWLLKK
jgi:hypothetical protein